MVKRIIDLIFAFSGLVAFIPLLIFTGCKIRRGIGKPIFFSQIRVGKNNQLFKLYKFRTMTNTTDQNGYLLPNEQRHTEIGKKIRKYSLDELPQLINVLRGDLSLVGPRPLLVDYLPLYTDKQARRHEVKPGITGWAQVNGRNAITWEEKFELDVWYVDNKSLILDFYILYLTILKVFKSDGVNSNEEMTMERFQGSAENA